MRDLPHHRFRDFLYGDPRRAVPWIYVALGVGAGVLARSPAVALATVVLGRQIWDRLSPRVVIEDSRLGALTLTCPQRSRGGDKQLWLTFDDGPGPATDAVLDVLEEFQAPATFFFIGQKIADYPNIAELRARLAAGSHRVGNHSFSHPNFLTLDSEATRIEVETAQFILSQTFPEASIPVFRPPYGYRTESLFTHVQAANLTTVGWSVNSLDFLSGSAQGVVDRVLRLARPGSVLLFHDGPGLRTRTVQALPAILRGLKEQGYSFVVPVPEGIL